MGGLGDAFRLRRASLTCRSDVMAAFDPLRTSRVQRPPATGCATAIMPADRYPRNRYPPLVTSRQTFVLPRQARSAGGLIQLWQLSGVTGGAVEKILGRVRSRRVTHRPCPPGDRLRPVIRKLRDEGNLTYEDDEVREGMDDIAKRGLDR